MELKWLIILGAFACGIVMFISNMKAKQGVAWGQPVTIIFGILATALACWGCFMHIFGASAEQKTAEKWQVVRGTGAAEWVNANCKDKKLLFVRPPQLPNMSADVQFEAFKKALDGSIKYEEFEVPPVKERVGEDMPGGDMMLDGITKESDIGRNKAAKKFVEESRDEFQKALSAKVASDKYDTVVFFTSVNDPLLFFKSYMIPDFKDKQYIFMFGIDEHKMKSYSKQIIACLGDKPLTNPDDYDKDPKGDPKADFDYRYEFKKPAETKKK